MKVYVFLAEGFEEIEAVTIIDVLRRARLDVKTVSISSGLEVTGAHSIKLFCDLMFDCDSMLDGDMLVLPGGPGTNKLYEHQGVVSLIKSYSEKDKWIAAICAAPFILGRMGLLNGKAATCYPGCETDLKGAVLSTDRVVHDGNIITSRCPATAMDFALKLVEVLKGKDLSDKLYSAMQC